MDNKTIKKLEEKAHMGVDGDGNLIWGFTVEEWLKLAKDEGWSIEVREHSSKEK